LSSYINFNGSIIPGDQKLVTADNRGFKYGDGLFETIKVAQNAICLANYHFERLFSSMQILQFDIPDFFTPETISNQILSLCEKNNHEESARVRINIFRGDGMLFEAAKNSPNYTIQTEKLSDRKFVFKEKGLITDLFTEGRKSCDKFSNIKTNSFLIYAMAALHAKKNLLDDCLILNSHERICECAIANVFCVKDKIIYTPPLSEGCVSGVMRRFIAERIISRNFLFKETSLSLENIKQADEVFLTNSIFGIRWVKEFGKIKYSNSFTKEIFECVFETR
jgi:branched-chain amino acid aminotransferase